MSFILYSPAHEEVRPALRRFNGEVVPEKTVTVGARSLYGIKGMTDRIYRSTFPVPGYHLHELMEFGTFAQAKRAQQGLLASCGELFQIRLYTDGKLGKNLDPGEPVEAEETEAAEHDEEG